MSCSLDKGKLAEPSGQFLTSSPVITHQAQILPSEILGPSARPISEADLRGTSLDLEDNPRVFDLTTPSGFALLRIAPVYVFAFGAMFGIFEYYRTVGASQILFLSMIVGSMVCLLCPVHGLG